MVGALGRKMFRNELGEYRSWREILVWNDFVKTPSSSIHRNYLLACEKLVELYSGPSSTLCKSSPCLDVRVISNEFDI